MTVDEAGIAAAHQNDPGTPCHHPNDTTSAPGAPPGCWVSRLFDKLLAHKQHGRNQRAYEEFMAQMETEAAAMAVSSAERATKEATSRAGTDRERARAAGAMEARGANRRKSPEAAARMRAAVAKAATERELPDHAFLVSRPEEHKCPAGISEVLCRCFPCRDPFGPRTLGRGHPCLRDRFR
jgi:hypothetical protein